MATQAKYFGTLDPVAGARGKDDIYRLRKLPNEDIYFFRKAIDNSRIVRRADPRGRTRCWRTIATTAAMTLALIGLLWPNIDGMLTGYELEGLKQQQQQLLAQKASLELEEAGLLSPERLEELARMQQFIDPAPEQVVYLNPKADGSLALNIRSK